MLDTPEKKRSSSSRQGRLLALPVVLAALIVLASIVFLLASLLGISEPDTGRETGALHSQLSRSAFAVRVPSAMLGKCAKALD